MSSGRSEPVLRVGAEVGEDVRVALAFTLRSTQANPQTEAELAAKLRAREYDEAIIVEALTQARRLRAVDDEAFATAWVAERGLGRGYGAVRLRQELGRRLVPQGLIEQALAALQGRDDLTAATDLARGRLAQLPASLAPEAVARRLVAYLVRRGHPTGLAERVAIDVSGLARDWD